MDIHRRKNTVYKYVKVWKGLRGSIEHIFFLTNLYLF